MSETDIENLTDVGQFMADTLTGGVLDVDVRTGEVKAGRLARAADEGLGEITGRNLQREQMQRAEARIAEEEASREKELVDEQKRERQQDVQASLTAQSVRRTAAAKQRSSSGGINSRLGAGGDFLGL